MEKHWFALVLALVCLLITDFSSKGAFRGVVMPFSAFFLLIVAGYFYIQRGVSEVVRPQNAYIPTAEEIAALKRAMAEKQAQTQARVVASNAPKNLTQNPD